MAVGDWMLVDAGYATSLVGKWPVGASRSISRYHVSLMTSLVSCLNGASSYRLFLTTQSLGYDRKSCRVVAKVAGLPLSVKVVYSTHLGYNETSHGVDNLIFRGGHRVRKTAYLTDAITRKDVGFIDRNADRPFFPDVAYNAVHSPLKGSDKSIRKFLISIPSIGTFLSPCWPM